MASPNSLLFERFLNGEELLPSEKSQLARALDEYDAMGNILNGVMGGVQSLERPMIFDSNWRTSPLHAFLAIFTTDQPITANTWTPITFDDYRGEASLFGFFGGDKTKIGVDRAQFGFEVNGFVAWGAAVDGDRVVRMELFNKDNASLGTQEIDSRPAPNSGGFGTKQSFSVGTDLRQDFPTLAYFKFEVLHNSATNPLNIEGGVVGAKLI